MWRGRKLIGLSILEKQFFKSSKRMGLLVDSLIPVWRSMNVVESRSDETLRKYSTKGNKIIKISEGKEITTSQLLSHLSGNVLQFAKSSEYNQAFSKLLLHASVEEFENVFNEILPNVYDLCTDINGSIVLERIIAGSLPHQLDLIFKNLFNDTIPRNDVVKLFSEECSARVLSKIIPKLTSNHVNGLLGILHFNCESIPLLLESENSTNLLTQLIDIHTSCLEKYIRQSIVLFLLDLDHDQINEQRLKQPLAKAIEKSTVSIKVNLIGSMIKDLTKLDERHSFAFSRAYTRLPIDSKEFEQTSSLIVKHFNELSMRREHKDIVNSYIGFSTRQSLDSLINSLTTDQIEELLKDKNGLIAFSYLFSKVTSKRVILEKLRGKIVELSKHVTSSFFFSSLVAENSECALTIIKIVTPHLVEISSNPNSSFLAIKIAEYPEGRKALLQTFKNNIVEYYASPCQQVIYHLINKSTATERSETLQNYVLPKVQLDDSSMPEPLFKLILLFIKRGSLNDYTNLVKLFEGYLQKMSAQRNTSIILQQLYQSSPQVIRDIMTSELLGDIQNPETIRSLKSKHSKHLLYIMIRSDPNVETLFKNSPQLQTFHFLLSK